jgi:Amt family ammonium transporter
MLGYLAMLMPVGFALVTCGLVRKKNAAHLAMLSLTAFVFPLLAYYAAGYAFQFGAIAPTPQPALGGEVARRTFLIGSGSWGVLGGTGFFLRGQVSGVTGFTVFKAAVMIVAAYVFIGAVCERITFWAFLVCQLFVGALLYPVFGCWVWGGGWLSQLGVTFGLGHGYVDFAGSSVVHAVGGFGAMALSAILGPRAGKYSTRGESNAFPAHNIVFVVVGTLVLLLGWISFNAGSVIDPSDPRTAGIAVNTILAAAGGSAAAIAVWSFAFDVPDISMACNGLLAGLVAIAAPCAFVGPSAAVLIGVLAGALVCAGVLFNDRVLRIDDPSGALSVHGYCGWFGAVALGIFADGTSGTGWNGIGATTYLGKAGQGVTGLLYGDLSQFVVQLGGATLSAVYAFALTYVVFKLVNAARPIRVAREVELEGLDLPEFGMLAYPEEDTL